jgi:hypothetical protein
LQVVQGREKVLGKEHVDTPDSKHRLALMLKRRRQKYTEAQELYRQQRYIEAEELFRLAIQLQEKVLGKEHIHTLDSKHWLALTFYTPPPPFP